MKSSDSHLKRFGDFSEHLGMIWNPAVEAMRLQLAVGVRSLADLSVVANQVECEIHSVDGLPSTVSGFADVLDGQRVIVVNRNKPLLHTGYTIAHEIGHHVLHLNPNRESALGSVMEDNFKEYEADLFATTLLGGIRDERERAEVQKQNGVSYLTACVPLIATIVLVVVAMIAFLFERPTQRQLPI